MSKVSNRRLIAALVIAWIGVSMTPFFDSVTVTPDYLLTEHRLGFPLPIIVQNTSLTPLEDAFPFELGLVNPWEHPTELLLDNYLLLIGLFGAVIYLILIFFIFLAGSIRKQRN